MKAYWGFAIYDFANSAYVLIFGTLLFPIYFREIMSEGSSSADFYWSLILASGMLIAVLLAPLVGLWADRRDRRTILASLAGASGFGMLVLSVLATTQRPIVVAIVFIATHAAFTLSVSVYDSYLSHVATAHKRPGISTFSWGFGYLGGVLCFASVLLVQQGSAEPTWRAFATTGSFFLIASCVSLNLLPRGIGQPRLQIRQGLALLRKAKAWKMLLAFWLINDGIMTITFFAALFGHVTLGLETKTIGTIFLIIQLLAFPGTWIVGRCAMVYGTARVIIVTVVIWCCVLLMLSFASTFQHLLILSVLSAFVIGSTQALMRAYYSCAMPAESSGFAFGVYACISRTSALVGPLSFGAVSSISGSQRLALLTALFPLLLGGLLFLGVVRSEQGGSGQ